MGYLEKVFLGCMALFALFIFFVFGLYFDLPEMIHGGVDRSGGLTRGAAVDRLVERLEASGRTVRTDEVRVPRERERLSRAVRSRPPSSMTQEAVKARWERFLRPGGGTDDSLVERHRHFLRSQGFTNPDFIEMEALAQDRSTVDRVLSRVETMIENGDIERALQTLQAGLNDLDPANLRLRQELMGRVLELSVALGDLDAARRHAETCISILTEILEVKESSEFISSDRGRKQVEAARIRVAEMRNELDSVFGNLRQRLETTGSVVGVLPDERTQMRVVLRQALDDGEMSREEYNEAVADIDSGLFERSRLFRDLSMEGDS